MLNKLVLEKMNDGNFNIYNLEFNFNIVEAVILKVGSSAKLARLLGVSVQAVILAKSRGYFSIKQMPLVKALFPEISSEQMLKAYADAQIRNVKLK